MLGLAQQITVWGVLGVGFSLVSVALIAAGVLNRQFGREWVVAFVSGVTVVALVAGIRWLLPVIRTGYRDATSMDRLPLRVDEAVRVRCVGGQGAIERMGPVSLEAFEPVIERLLFASTPGRSFIVAWVVGAGLCLIGLLVIAELAGTGFRIGPVSLWSFGYFIFGLVAFSGCLIAAAVYPTYVRISPGRVDVITFSFLGRRVRELQRYDVGRDRVLVLLRVGAAIVEPAEDAGAPIEPESAVKTRDSKSAPRCILFAGSMNRTGLARDILAAAISPHPTPALPEDRLL